MESLQPHFSSGTTYNNMNDWRSLRGQIVPSQLPVRLSDNTWKTTEDDAENDRLSREARGDEIQHRIDQLYSTVTHPKSIAPRERQGDIGGSWRHIKEVLGHGGSRVVFVDGLVRLYDSDRKSRRLGTTTLPPLQSSAATPRYAPSYYDVCTHRKAMDMQHEKSTYNPWKSAAF